MMHNLHFLHNASPMRVSARFSIAQVLHNLHFLSAGQRVCAESANRVQTIYTLKPLSMLDCADSAENATGISMETYRFKLASNKVKKITCRYCKKKGHWQRYIDTVTGEVLPEIYGKCDNAVKCGNWNKVPKGYSKQAGLTPMSKAAFQPVQPPPDPIPFDFDTFLQTLKGYEQNTFIQNLPCQFDPQEVTRVIRLYRLGTVTSGYMAGAITFPYIDTKDNVRAIQVKKFDQFNRTIKKHGTTSLSYIIAKEHPGPLPEWLQAYLKQEKKVTCLFGAHLLPQYPGRPVCLVEAPKTAIYGTLWFGFPDDPQQPLWLAVYNLSSFTFDRIKDLQGRTVYVFPDLSKGGTAFQQWSEKAQQYEPQLPGTRFVFSDLLERLAPEQDRSEGKDLADYLIELDPKAFRPSEVTKVTFVTPEKKHFLTTQPPAEDQEEIDTLEAYFLSIELPTEPIKLNQCSTITDVRGFIQTTIETARTYSGKPIGQPYLDDLKELQKILNRNLQK